MRSTESAIKSSYPTSFLKVQIQVLSCITEAVYDFPYSHSHSQVNSNDTAVDSDKKRTKIIAILCRFGGDVNVIHQR